MTRLVQIRNDGERRVALVEEPRLRFLAEAASVYDLPRLPSAPERRSRRWWRSASGSALWSKEIRTGEAEMCHSLQNIEHHHLKFEVHRRPGDPHVHFFGAYGLSFGDGVELADGDVMEIRFEGFGRPLRNPVSVSRTADSLVTVQPLT